MLSAAPGVALRSQETPVLVSDGSFVVEMSSVSQGGGQADSWYLEGSLSGGVVLSGELDKNLCTAWPQKSRDGHLRGP